LSLLQIIRNLGGGWVGRKKVEYIQFFNLSIQLRNFISVVDAHLNKLGSQLVVDQHQVGELVRGYFSVLVVSLGDCAESVKKRTLAILVLSHRC
jgi:hypothetical protein